MRTHRLHDELPSKQEQQCQQLGADLYVEFDADDADEPAFGADPFDILAFREQQGDMQ